MAFNKNFIIRNGLEVDGDLILADPELNKVGIGTTNLISTLTISGDISGIAANFSGIVTASKFNGDVESSYVNSTNIESIGISTLNNIKINGLITAGSSEGVSGQYLKHVGTGVTWANIPSLREIDTQTASEGQNLFSTTYTVGLLDVYVNGVRLTNSEFTANNGTTVTLSDSAFEGDTLEFVSFTPFQSGVLPVDISVSGNQLIFSVPGIGLTSLSLS